VDAPVARRIDVEDPVVVVHPAHAAQPGERIGAQRCISRAL
jgi:hypothetical protein